MAPSSNYFDRMVDVYADYRDEVVSNVVKFMVRAWDVPGDPGIALRNELRAAHTETITARFSEGSVLLGAGVYDDAGVVRGSVVILDCESRAAVDSYLETEPFQIGGLWKRVEVDELRVPDMYLEHFPRPTG